MTIPVKFKQAFYASSSLFHMMGLGMMYGFPAIMIPELLEGKEDLKLDPSTASWIAGLPGISGLVTVFIVGPMMHVYGRKTTQIALTTPICIGWILTAFSYNLPMLIAGRFLQGLNNGLIYFHSICIAELSCPSIRGILLNFKIFAVSTGILVIHGFGYFLHWRNLAWIGTIPIVLGITIAAFWPESPEWLVSKGRYEEARSVFYKLRGRSEKMETEIRALIESERIRTANKQNSERDLLKRLKSRVFWRPIILMTLIMITVETGGRHFFPAYSLQLVTNITGEKRNALFYTLCIDSVMCLAGLASNFFVFRYPRRKLLLSYGYISNIFLLSACLLMYIRKKYYETEFMMWASLSLFGMYVLIVYGATFGVCFSLMGELLPLEFRAIATVVDGIMACAILTVTLKLSPVLKNKLDIHGMFFVFSLCMLVCLTYLKYDLPETKDRTLLDIGDYFRGKSPKVPSSRKCEKRGTSVEDESVKMI